MDVCRFYFCPPDDILDTKKNILILMLVLQCKEKKAEQQQNKYILKPM